MHETDRKEFNMDEALEYCFNFVRNTAITWKELKEDPSARLCFQKLIFTGNIKFSGETFGTTDLSLVYKLNQENVTDKSQLIPTTPIPELFSRIIHPKLVKFGVLDADAAFPNQYSELNRNKIARNAASSWTQSGHLSGRAKKIRKRVNPSAVAVTMALFIGICSGFHGSAVFSNPWCRLLDLNSDQARTKGFEAHRAAPDPRERWMNRSSG